MPKRLSSRKVVKILTGSGFAFVSQRGSHQKYRNPNGRVVIVPAERKEIPVGAMTSNYPPIRSRLKPLQVDAGSAGAVTNSGSRLESPHWNHNALARVRRSLASAGLRMIAPAAAGPIRRITPAAAEPICRVARMSIRSGSGRIDTPIPSAQTALQFPHGFVISA